jgi:hypothetical protein
MRKHFLPAFSILLCCFGLVVFSSARIYGESLTESYRNILKLKPLDDKDKKDIDLAVRLIEEHGSMIVSYLIEFSNSQNSLNARIVVHRLDRMNPGSGRINTRDLLVEETRSLANIINRKEILFLSEEFQDTFDFALEKSPSYSVEIFSYRKMIGNSLVRSFSQSDCLEELRNWIVSIAHTPNEGWIVE